MNRRWPINMAVLGGVLFAVLVLSVTLPTSWNPSKKQPLPYSKDMAELFPGTVLTFYEPSGHGERPLFDDTLERNQLRELPGLRLVRLHRELTELELLEQFAGLEEKPQLIVTANPDRWVEKGLLQAWSGIELKAPVYRLYEIEGSGYGVHAQYPLLFTYYNKDLFDEYGLEYPDEAADWDELYELAVLLSRFPGQEGRGSLRMSLRHACDTFVDHADDIITKEKVMFSRGWSDCFENAKRFFTIPGNELSDETLRSGQQDFVNGRLPLWIGPIIAPLHQLAEEEQPFRWGTVSYPNFVPADTPVGKLVIGLTPETGDYLQEAAWVMDLLLAPDRQLSRISYYKPTVLFPYVSWLEQVILGMHDTNTALRTAEEQLWIRLNRPD